MLKRLVSIVLVLALIFSNGLVSVASENEGESEVVQNQEEVQTEENNVEEDEDVEDENNEDEEVVEEEDDEEDDEEDKEDDEEDEDEDEDDEDEDEEDEDDLDEDHKYNKKDRYKKYEEWKKIKKEIKEEEQEINKLKKELKELYKGIKKIGDTDIEEQLKEDLEVILERFSELKDEMHTLLAERKEIIRSKYTDKELEEIKESENKIKDEKSNVKVLSIDSILSDSVEFKFDTPPVIIEGRTLVPVRAITEGYGAKVEWKAETKEAIILKGEIEIILPLDSNKVLVNGDEVILDTQSDLMNDRIYVPLRFILETFGLDIEWDGETETIEVNEL
ncbi:stalk domain-containing protein [Vallitalea okinawensis]|uniref:stalk domain-containing protein n=1 Tax=Vallitalea okinawensis TaxID=2078660 RepID=UPI001478401F|nr:copper amine oxidase N-terminal domain-containing protein [Vallitalea okinawensis]